MDNKINEHSIKILQIAPLLLLAMSWWSLGNRQIFQNEYSFKSVLYGDPVQEQLHLFRGQFNNTDGKADYHMFPILIAAPLILFYNIPIKYLTILFNHCGCLKSIENI